MPLGILVNIIKEMLFPTVAGCPSCGHQGSPRHFCRSCLELWAELVAGMEICQLCGRFYEGVGCDATCTDAARSSERLVHGAICLECQLQSPPFIAARAPLPYEGPIRELLHSYKYSGRRELAVPCGELLGVMVAELYPLRQLGAVVSVPLHPGRLRDRGFDQAALLAGATARYLGVHQVSDALVRQRETPSQTTLTREQRLVNLAGVFAAGGKIEQVQGKTVLLVDDIFTTGATVAESTRTLLREGAAGVYVATLASGFGRRD